MSQLDDFREFCAELVLDNGRQMLLEPFQETFLADYFDGRRETLVLIPKKNSKTTTLAAVALFHLVTTPDAECVVGAASRDQATILFDQASGLVRRTPGLAEQIIVKRGYRALHVADGAGRIRVLAADVDTADGVLPSLALVDELHRHKSADLYGVFRDGLGPRNGQMITISTAGDDETSPLGQLRTMAHSLPGLIRHGAHRYVTTDSFAMHEWALDSDEDRDDIALVKLANPASWQTFSALKERHDSPSMTPWQWARFACGVWLAGEDGAISDKEWRACADPSCEIPADATGVVAGIDLGWKWDSTAIVPVWKDAEGIAIVGEPIILTPPRDGTSLDAEAVHEAVKEVWSRYAEVQFVLDPEAGGEQTAQWIEAELGTEPATHSQKAPAMALAAQRLSEAISGHRLRHPDDQTLNTHVLAAVAKPVGEGWRLVKSKRKRMPIDGAVALAMANSVAAHPPAKKKKGIAFLA